MRLLTSTHYSHQPPYHAAHVQRVYARSGAPYLGQAIEAGEVVATAEATTRYEAERALMRATTDHYRNHYNR